MRKWVRRALREGRGRVPGHPTELKDVYQPYEMEAIIGDLTNRWKYHKGFSSSGIIFYYNPKTDEHSVRIRAALGDITFGFPLAEVSERDISHLSGFRDGYEFKNPEDWEHGAGYDDNLNYINIAYGLEKSGKWECVVMKIQG